MSNITKQINLVPYNPNWPEQFEAEAEGIKKALGDNFIDIHHIGSTSVPGLSAKEDIDIACVVSDLDRAVISLNNYTFKGEYNIPLRYFFSKNTDCSKVNLHVYEEMHPEIELNLTFRDYLRSNANAREEYAELKNQLLLDQSSHSKDNSVFTNYTLRKGNFIRKLLKQAGFDRVRMLKCNDETEWKKAKDFRSKYFGALLGTDDPYSQTLNHPEHEHLILYQGTEIIGYAHIQVWKYSKAAIHVIIIDETKRNNNLDNVFLSLCKNWLIRRGYNSIHSKPSHGALNF
jgi:GrpB-like predicted nucleotidyltransferase (UPF0157 family)